MNDAPTYACDECQCPAELTELVPFKDQHICRLCFERHHPPEAVTKDMLRKLLGDEKPVAKNGWGRSA